MALVKCPKCGQAISEVAKKCVHCGELVTEEPPFKIERKCRECFCVLSESDKICPSCGCPVSKDIDIVAEPQRGESATLSASGKTKKVVLCVTIVVLVCAVVVFGIYAMNQAKAKKEHDEYIDKLEQAQTLMISSAGNAEALCDMTSKVWGNSIYEKSDITTDKYTKVKGIWHSDFNTALQSLYSAEETRTAIAALEDEQHEIEELIKTMQAPPKDLEKCYDTLSDLYDSYASLTALAVTPSGNYAGFNAGSNAAVNDFLSNFKKLSVQLPEKSATK